MSKNVEYERQCRFSDAVTQNDDIQQWAESNLGSGGIESSVDRLSESVAFLLARVVENHPELIREVAELVNCDGYRHKVVDGDE